jgi:hypothetical protein
LNNVVTIPAGGHVAFSTQDRFPEIAGLRGVAEFTSSSAPFSAIALRFNSTGAFTTVPVFPGTPNSQSSTLVTKIIPQIADGGSWSTTIVLVNTGLARGFVNLNFYQDPAGTLWSLAVNSSSSLQLVPPGTATFVETLGTAATLTTGYAKITADPGVEAFAIFKSRVPGRQDQEGTAPASLATQEILAPFDNTSGNVTGLAIVNSGSDQTVLAKFLNTAGGITVAGGAHSTFVMTDQFPVSSGFQGVVDFSTSNSPLSIIALRFNSTGAFASLPAFAAVPAPVKNPAQIVSPAPQSTPTVITIPSFTLTWTPGAGAVSSYSVTVGTAPGKADLFSYPLIGGPSTTSSRIPLPANSMNGQVIYVTLITTFSDYTSAQSTATYTLQSFYDAIAGTYTLPSGVSGSITTRYYCQSQGPGSVQPATTSGIQPTVVLSADAQHGGADMYMTNVSPAFLPTYTYLVPVSPNAYDQYSSTSILATSTGSYLDQLAGASGMTITRNFASGYMELSGLNGGNTITFSGYKAGDATHCATIFEETVSMGYRKPL